MVPGTSITVSSVPSGLTAYGEAAQAPAVGGGATLSFTGCFDIGGNSQFNFNFGGGGTSAVGGLGPTTAACISNMDNNPQAITNGGSLTGTDKWCCARASSTAGVWGVASATLNH